MTGLLGSVVCALFGHRPLTCAIFLVDPPWQELVCLRCGARWTEAALAESIPGVGNPPRGGPGESKEGGSER